MDRLRTVAWTLGFVSLALTPAMARADWPASPLTNVPVCTAAGTQDVSSLIGDGLGGMIVVWSDSRSGNDDIYAQRLDAAGVPLWTANGVALCVAADEQSYPEAIPDGAGGAIVAWHDYRNGGTADIYVQRIDATGATLWTLSGEPLCTAGGSQLFPKVVSDGAEGAVVVWI